MGLKFKAKKVYRKFLFYLSASENPVYLAYYKFFFRPESGTLDEFLDKYSKEHKQVTFLQIGANDGFINDPLHKFIKRDNWKGILLEPLPDVYNDYLVKLHRKRPEILPINAALDVKDGTRSLYKLAISKERWATGLSSFNRDVLLRKMKDGSMLKNIRRQGIVVPENEDDIVVEEKVDTISADTLLKKFTDENLNLLAIDTEGFDFEVLKMLDLSRISPEVIIYEESNFDEKTTRECRAYLEKYNYSCRTIKRDVLATKK